MVTIRNKVTVATAYGPCDFYSFHALKDQREHFAIVFKDNIRKSLPLVRIHSECMTGDVFSSKLCDCGDQLDEALALFSEQGGVLLYLRQEGRGIGLYNKLDAYALQHSGFDTLESNQLLNLPADMRNYEVAADMLKAMAVNNIILLSNNPDKQKQLEQYGIFVKKRQNTGLYLKDENIRYLTTKIKKMGHSFPRNNLTLKELLI